MVLNTVRQTLDQLDSTSQSVLVELLKHMSLEELDRFMVMICVQLVPPSVLKSRNAALPTQAWKILNSFTPYNQQYLYEKDLDIGSGGVLLIPNNVGYSQQLAITGGKQGILYVLDRSARSS